VRLNFKTIIVGGIIFYAAQWVLGMISGIVIHEGVVGWYVGKFASD
jgi:hypothetical protein